MSDSWPLVSIGLPVYNGEKYIHQAIDSLLKQDYENFELIISDNASTDRTHEICMEYATSDQRIQYHQNKTNIGAIANFKKVLDLAQGPYFAWAAYDDLWEPSAIKSALLCFIFNEDVVFAWSFFDAINYVTGKVEQCDVPELNKENNAFQNCCNLLSCPSPSLIYGMFRKEILKKTRFVSMEYFDFGDLYLLYEIATMGEMQIVPYVLYHVGTVEVVRTPKSYAKHNPLGFKFNYSRYYFESLKLFLRSNILSLQQKLHLIQLLNSQVVRLITHHEKSILDSYRAFILRKFCFWKSK